MKKINYALESFKNIQDLIKFIDQKANAILLVISLIFTVFVQNMRNLTFVFNNPSASEVIVFLAGLSVIVSLLIVMYYSIFEILKPRSAKNYKKGDFSTFYFEHIATESESIHAKFDKLDENIMLKDILDQKIEISKILNEKRVNLSISFVWLFVSLISSIIFIILSTQL